MAPIRILVLLVVFAAVTSLAACGGAGSYGGERCVDYQGFPVDCDAPGAEPVKPGPGPAAAIWEHSAAGADVLAAFGDVVRFSADPAHALIVDGVPSASLRTTEDGTVQRDGVPVGHVAWIVRADGTTGTALVSADGFLLEVTMELDGPGLLASQERPTYVPQGSLDVPSAASMATGLPIANLR